MVVVSWQFGGPLSTTHWVRLSLKTRLSSAPSAPVVMSAPVLSFTFLIEPFSTSVSSILNLELADIEEPAQSELSGWEQLAPLFRQPPEPRKQSGLVGTMFICALVAPRAVVPTASSRAARVIDRALMGDLLPFERVVRGSSDSVRPL